MVGRFVPFVRSFSDLLLSRSDCCAQEIRHYALGLLTAKLNAEAATLWFRSYDGPSDEDYDGDPKLVIDAAGNAILTGNPRVVAPALVPS